MIPLDHDAADRCVDRFATIAASDQSGKASCRICVKVILRWQRHGKVRQGVMTRQPVTSDKLVRPEEEEAECA